MSDWSSDYPFLLALMTHRSKELVPAPDRLRQFAKENKKAHPHPRRNFPLPFRCPWQKQLRLASLEHTGASLQGAYTLADTPSCFLPLLRRASFLLPSDCLLFLSVSPETRQNEDWLVFPPFTPSTPHLFLYLGSLPLAKRQMVQSPGRTRSAVQAKQP